MNGHKQTMHMKNGQGVNQHIVLFPTPIGLEGLGIAQHVAVGQHGAFAAPSGTTGVQNCSQVVGFLNRNFVLIFVVRCTLEQGARAIVIQGEHMLCACLECNFANPPKISARTNHHRWLGIANEVLNLGTLVGSVQRQEHIACAQGGQVKHHGFH